MIKKLIALGLLAALLCAPLTGWGETVTLETVMQYRDNITSVGGTGYVIATDRYSSLRAVFQTDGTQLTPYLYSSLSYLGYNFFVGYNEAGANTRGLTHVSGVRLTDEQYGDFALFSRKWVAGYVLSPAQEEAHTYTRGKEYFNIDRVDVFFIPDPSVPAQPVASLAPAEFAAAKARGKYLAVQKADGTFVLYDQDFRPMDFEMDSLNTPVYRVENYALMDLASGEAIADGFLSVSELLFNGDTVLMATSSNFKGDPETSLLDPAGNRIQDVAYALYTAGGDYAVTTADRNRQKGLYSLSQERVLVPCAYNNIMASKVSLDKYVFNGYAAVENGKLRGYVDTRTGEISCEVKYDTKTVTTIGCTTFWKVADGVYMLAAADGVETEVHVDSIYEKTRGDGRLLVAQKDRLYGVIDWHGNEILPFYHKKLIVITDDSKALIRTSTGTQMDMIVYGE